MSTAVSLSNFDREQNYRRQNLTFRGRTDLTPAQNRRKRKHENKAKDGYPQDAPMSEFIEIVDDIQSVVSLPEVEPADSVGMRPCGGTDYCLTKTGNKASKPHKSCA